MAKFVFKHKGDVNVEHMGDIRVGKMTYIADGRSVQIDMQALAAELRRMREYAVIGTADDENTSVIVGQAEDALAKGDKSALLQRLSSLGSAGLRIAESVSAGIVLQIAKDRFGMGS